MRVTEKLVKSPEEEGVTLAYIRLTKDFEEIKEYVQHKGDQYNAGGMFDCMYWAGCTCKICRVLFSQC